jgi:crossover junction endodeoxyribonuclease RuvC
MSEKSKIILGIDPGTLAMGYGLIELKKNKPSMLDMGVERLEKLGNMYNRLARIYTFIDEIIIKFKPDELAIEAQFYGKDVQAMLKLGRAQGVSITPALIRNIPVFEYAPRKIKVAVTGNGNASKEQVALMLGKILKIDVKSESLDATDGLATALCHHYQTQFPSAQKSNSSWSDFIKNNPDRIK